MNEYLEGFDRKEVTLRAPSNAKAGQTVNFLTKNYMSLVASDQLFCGVCTSVIDGYGSYVLRGYVRVSYSGTAPTVGYSKLAGDGLGGVMVSDNGRLILVSDVDKENLTCGIIL